MRLEKLVMQGFKSFADKTTFTFDKNFTAVVGPNGSGKSNVSDAMRWVLGEQSMRLLRAKSSTDLIFGGSETLPKMSMAMVEMHLDNKDGAFPLEYEEVVISRKMFGDGESEYRINNAKVRLQDILMMLAQARFGQKSYAVIGQGMITDFLNATPQERKEFFDEATGVKEFQIKRDKAINKLIRAEENLVQSEALVAEIEPHLKSLERQVKRLEKREKIELELADIQVEFYGTQWSDLQKEQKQLRAEEKKLAGEETALAKELEQLQKQSDKLATEASRGERYQQLQQQFNVVLEEKSHVLKDQAVLKGKLEVEHERQGELSLVWLERKEDDIASEVRTQEEELRSLQEQQEQEKRELARHEQRLKTIQQEFKDEEYSILQLKERIETESEQLSVPEIRRELTGLFDEQEAFLKSLLQTKSLDEFRTLQSNAKSITKKFATFMDRLMADERDTIEALRVELKQKEASLERLAQERETTQHKVNELRVAAATTESKRALLESQAGRLKEELAGVRADLTEAKEENKAAQKHTKAAEYSAELATFEKQIEQFNVELDRIRKEIDAFNQEEEEKKSALVALQSSMRSVQRKLDALRQQQRTVEINTARVETRLEDTKAELHRDVAEALHTSIYNYTGTPASGLSNTQLEQKMTSLHKQLEAIGSVDQETVDEYNSTKERYDFLSGQINDLNKSIEQLEKVIDELDATIKTQFQRNFKKINEGFQDYFKVLFDGGKAELKLVTELPHPEETAPQTEEEKQEESLHDEKERELIGKKKKKQKIIAGIDVIASPPRKKVTNITALSGGEKSLVAVALLCSIIANNPSPFVVLDEIEAALDEENSEKLAAIIKDLSEKTQIVIITHNRVTMRAADILYGVTIGKDGKSHILSVELKEAQEMVAE